MLARRTALAACLGILGCNALLGIEPAVQAPPGTDAAAPDASRERSDEEPTAPSTVDAAAPDPPAPDAGACTDTDSNPRHCGVCDHDCGPARCVAGACQPGVLVTDTIAPHAVVVTPKHVFYQTTFGDVRRVPIAGGPPATLFSAGGAGSLGRNLVTIGEHVYFSDRAEKRVARCPILGACTAPETIFALATPYLLATTDGELYAADGPRGATIRRCTPPSCATPETIAAGADGITLLAAVGDSVYWATDESNGRALARRKPRAGGAEVIVFGSLTTNGVALKSLAAAGRYAYGVYDGDLLGFVLDAPGTVLVTQSGNTDTLSIAEDSFWYGEAAGPKIFRRSLTTPRPAPSVLEVTADGPVIALVKDATGIYWVANNRLMRLVR